jgi:Protein of unknown function (DUF2738)
MAAIVDGTNIDYSILTYSKPKAHASGGKVVNVYNKTDMKGLSLQTPLILTWGAQEGKDQQGNPTGKYTMSLQFASEEYSNPELNAFLENMKGLVAKIKKDAMANSKEWFGKVITSDDVIEEKFNVMLRHPKKKGTEELDESKPPTLTVKIPCWNGSWKSEIYDEDGEPLYVNGKVNTHQSPLEYLKPKCHVIAVIQCGGLWFVNGKVSITWNLHQAVVQKPAPSTEGQCLIKLKHTDKEKMKALPQPEDNIDPDGAVSATVVADSDDEREIDYATPAPTPTPVPEPTPTSVPAPIQEPVATATAATAVEEAPKKKIIRKKTT